MIRQGMLAAAMLTLAANASAQEAPRACTGFDFSTGVVVETMAPDGPLTISRVAEGGPAADAGLQVGDRILEIDGVEVTQIPYTGGHLRGEPGSSRQLLVQRNDSTFVVTHVTGSVVTDEAGIRRCRARDKRGSLHGADMVPADIVSGADRHYPFENRYLTNVGDP